MPPHADAFTRKEVLFGGFEAACVAADGRRYLWHGDRGLRVDPRENTTTLISDSALMPEGSWTPTPWGRQQLAGGRDASAGARD